MPTSSSRRLSLHARSRHNDSDSPGLPHRRASQRHLTWVIAFGVGLGLAGESFADRRGSSTQGRSTSSRTATAKPAPTTRTATPRYRNHGQVRGGTGQAPVKQTPPVSLLSGIPAQSFQARPYGSSVPHSGRAGYAPRHGGSHHAGSGHRAPQVIYVPVDYGYGHQREEPPVIYVEAPPAPPPVVVVTPQPPVPTPAAPVSAIPPPPAAPPARTSNEPGRLRLEIQPADAEVYLDDRPLALTAGGLQLPAKPGIHVLEITHPDHEAERLVFAVDPEQALRVAIDLRESKPGRRTRID